MDDFAIAFDTNMLVGKEGDCERYVAELATPSPRFKLALDKRGFIKDEYQEEETIFIKSAKASGKGMWGDSPLSRLLQMIDLFSGDKSPVVHLDASLPDLEMEFLKELKCHQEIEPTLFGMGKKYSGSVYVMLTGRLKGRRARGYPDNYNIIRDRYLQKNQQVKDSLDRILHDSPCPSDYKSLKRILDKAKWKEDERHEFKLIYNKDTRTKLAKEVCGFLNREGGYIFIGITDPPDAQLTGFDWQYDGDGISSSSGRKDAMVDFISTCIHPLPTKIVVREVDVPASHLIPHETTEDLSPERLMVIAIYAPKGAESYCFYDKDRTKWVNCKRIDSICKAQYQDCPHPPGFHPEK